MKFNSSTADVLIILLYFSSVNILGDLHEQRLLHVDFQPKEDQLTLNNKFFVVGWKKALM